MKVRILDNGKVNHNGHILEELEIYDLPDNVAESLIASNNAKVVDQSKRALPEPETNGPVTPRFNAKANGYVAEAKPQKPLKPEEIDDTPVVSKVADTTPLPKTQTKLYDEHGKEITPEEAKALEQQPGASATKPTVTEAQKAQTVKK